METPEVEEKKQFIFNIPQSGNTSSKEVVFDYQNYKQQKVRPNTQILSKSFQLKN